MIIKVYSRMMPFWNVLFICNLGFFCLLILARIHKKTTKLSIVYFLHFFNPQLWSISLVQRVLILCGKNNLLYYIAWYLSAFWVWSHKVIYAKPAYIPWSLKMLRNINEGYTIYIVRIRPFALIAYTARLLFSEYLRCGWLLSSYKVPPSVPTRVLGSGGTAKVLCNGCT